MENVKKLKMQEIVEVILGDMKKGVMPWQMPWVTTGLCPENATTGHTYRGVNILFLAAIQNRKGFKTGRWVTFRQATLAGGRIKTGEHGFPVVFYDRTTKKETTTNPDGTTEEQLKTFSLLKFFTIFNLDQTEGLEKLYPAPGQEKPFEDVAAAENIITQTGACIRRMAQARAYYDPATDQITTPPRESFKDAACFYSTTFHELTHWTGSEKRLKRNIKNPFGTPEYAFEELVAELGAAFLMNRVAMPYSTQHAAYVEIWIQALQKDVRAIFHAAALAQNAADLVLGVEHKKKEDQAA